MSRQLSALIFLVGIIGLAPGHSTADSFSSRFYGEVNLAISGVRHSTLDFYPSLGGISAGAWLFRGIGLEVYGEKGLSSDGEGDFDLELTETGGVALRFQSPAKNGFFGYMVLGHTRLTIEQINKSTERRVVQTYCGGRVSLGFGRNFKSIKGLSMTAEYRNYFVNDDIPIDSLSAGLRFNLR